MDTPNGKYRPTAAYSVKQISVNFVGEEANNANVKNSSTCRCSKLVIGIAVVLGLTIASVVSVVVVVFIADGDNNSSATPAPLRNSTTSYDSALPTRSTTLFPPSSTSTWPKSTASASIQTSTSISTSTGGQWTQWSDWTACTSTCGSGIHKRYRSCNSTTSGLCIGDFIEQEVCTSIVCPVYGKWTTWSPWNSCDKTCGSGAQTRIRMCQKNFDTDLDCVGNKSHTQPCSHWKCPDCNQTCDVGLLNSECDTCVCEFNLFNGRIVSASTGFPIKGVNLYAASAPTRLLTSTNSTGYYSLRSTCATSELYLTKNGFLDKYVEIIGSEMQISMAQIVLPYFSEIPQSKNRLLGDSASFCCVAQGSPTISYYEWFKNSILLSDSMYPTGTYLQLLNVTRSDSGHYKCRANSPVGSIMSAVALLDVKEISDEFCVDELQQRSMSLPPDCVQPDTNATYTVAGCNQCRKVGSNKDESCREEITSCCATGQYELKNIQCTGYSLDVIGIKSCTCGTCSDSTITITGTVTGINSTAPLVNGEVWVNGELKTYTDLSGSYNFKFSKTIDEVVITYIDTYFKKFLSFTKVIKISDGINGPTQVDISMVQAAKPVEVQSDLDNIISASSSYDQSSSGVTLSLPANAFYYPNGSQYAGSVSTTLTFLDPSDPAEISLIPGNLLSVDEEGETGHLESVGVFNLFIQDSSGNQLTINSGIDITVPEAILSNIDMANLELWKLVHGTGRWEQINNSNNQRRKKRQFSTDFINTFDFSQITSRDWFTLHPVGLQKICFLKLRTFQSFSLEQEVYTSSRTIGIEQHF